MRRGVDGKRLVAVVVFLSVLAAASCSAQHESPLSHTEAERGLMAVVENTADLLPDRDWRPLAGRPAPRTCSDQNEAEFGWTLVADPGTNHLEDAQRISESWQQLGMTVRLVERPHPVVFATGGGFQGMSFSTGPGRYYITATSLCFEGDAADLESRPTLAPSPHDPF